jgi:phage terminase large subunit-like protein
LVERSHIDRRITIHHGSTLENRANLSIEYLSTLMAMYAGTALERQEIYGELIDVIEGAMWRATDFAYGIPTDEDRVLRVIGVDPGVTTGGDATGIVAVRATTTKPLFRRRAWVMADYTDPELGPDRWPVQVVDAWREHDRPDRGERCVVVAEKNQGGELVSAAIAQVDPTCPVALVSAKGSKASRAEPCLLAYRQDRVRHAVELTELQDELTSWEPTSQWSPNRLDAMVHGLRALLVDDTPLHRFMGATWGTQALTTTLPAAIPAYRREREGGGHGAFGSGYRQERDR